MKENKMNELIEMLNKEKQVNYFDEYPHDELNNRIKEKGYSIVCKLCQGEENKHRWYSTIDTVFAVFLNNDFVGHIKSHLINDLNSELSSIEDIFFTPKFKECEPKEKTIIIYEEIK